MLDNYTRRYVEDTFGCRIVDAYSCVETGCNIAFQCKEGRYHVHSDFVLVEALDKDFEPLPQGREEGYALLDSMEGVHQLLDIPAWMIG